MNVYLVIILAILIGKFALDSIVGILNVQHISSELPREFVGYYDAQKYAASGKYLKENTYFSLAQDTFFILIVIAFIILGGFNFVDELARGLGLPAISTGLIFVGILALSFELISIPFSAYRTFVIERRYGFNRMDLRTFILDIIKSLALGALIGGAVFSFITWFFMSVGSFAWIWCWLGVSVFELFIIFIAPVAIMPLFNKFIPLEEGALKNSIFDYAKGQDFVIKDIFRMDASRRSSKSNAFFTGFGRNRRIVLFDTLIDKHTPDELVSVLAHEIGHYKKKHILKMFVVSILTTGIMFFILSFFINNQGLFSAFRMDHPSVYASLIFFGFLYAPINLIFSILINSLSRRHEYQADIFAITSYKKPEAFITALKKLTVDNLTLLTPHPLKVFLYYSHPPVLERIKVIRKFMAHS